MAEILHARPTPGVHGYVGRDLAWVTTDKPGLALAPVRANREAGSFLGYLRFEHMAETGIHQHLGPAFSYFLEGGLADYQGFARQGEVGINLAGATHSAIAYAPTLMASRLEAPVIYPSEDGVEAPLHTGARPGEIVNESPEVLPDINVMLEDLPWGGTAHAGVQRRMVFDYAMTGDPHRHVQLRLLPGTRLPPFRAAGPVDIFVIGGDLEVSGVRQGAGDFFVLDEGARAELSTRYGALLLAWAEGPSQWERAAAPDLWGFAARR